jgi:Zn-dependent M28 family amino/carboxypeptidase
MQRWKSQIPAARAALARCLLAGSLALSLALSVRAVAADPGGVEAAVQAMEAKSFLHHIEVLSSDDFEGRSVGTHGGEVTEQYLVSEFRRLGLAPGNPGGGPDGSYLQAVPLSGHTGTPRASVHAGGRTLELRPREDIVAMSFERARHVEVKASELVFAGYGVVAPEYGWDDFKGLDVKGKTLVVLVNDPQIPDPKDPSRLDDTMFKGKAMTYYGRWTYKYESAAAMGAAAVLIVHETKTAAYPWEVVVNSFGRENFDVDYGGANPNFPKVPAWITTDAAREIFALAGKDFDQLKAAALQRDFRALPLGASIDIAIEKAWRNIPSHNVLGRIEGSDPKLRGEVVLYTAHWDHFGWDPQLPGRKTEQIYHGALDNASGVAALLELARAYKALPAPPRRSILFIATTAEERGLLGAQYYATHPLVALARTVADINMDGMNVHGRTRDVEVIGFGNSELDDVLAARATRQGRVIVPDQVPEHGGFFRADHFEFAKVGVPALYAGGGMDYLGKPAEYGRSVVDHYTEHDYHKTTDVVRADWDLSGAMQDLELLFEVGYDVAQSARAPKWKSGSEFRARGESR